MSTRFVCADSTGATLTSLTTYLGRGGTGVINGTSSGKVVCPSGGTYAATTVNVAPTCNKSTTLSHQLP